MTDGQIFASSRFPVGLEEGQDGSAHVHSLSVPGCVATGTTKENALDSFTSVLSAWISFLEEQGEAVPSPEEELEIGVQEWITTDADVRGGESNVCFAADRKPLTEGELRRGLQFLGALRGRLLPLIRRASDMQLERWGTEDLNARVILDELARAQWWTLTRLGASPLARVPDAVVARLDTAMALTIQSLAELPESRRGGSIEIDGEEWTPRKVLRRILWLEWTLGATALQTILTAEGAER